MRVLLDPHKKSAVRTFVLCMLGAPVVKIELDESQVEAAIDAAHQYVCDHLHRELNEEDVNALRSLIQEGALIFAKEMLGRIRSKYKKVPGPNGGCQLDGQVLLAESQNALPEWKKEVRKLLKSGV